MLKSPVNVQNWQNSIGPWQSLPKEEIEVLTGRRLKPKNRYDLSDGVIKMMLFNVLLTSIILGNKMTFKFIIGKSLTYFN